jgi:uncharacterized protein (TIGR02594 family)
MNGAEYQPDPPWLVEARKHDGQAEVPGAGSNQWIADVWATLKNGSWYWSHYGKDDSLLPWCGAFVAFCIQRSGLEYPKLYASARAWADWGELAGHFVRGGIVVFARKGGGHVGFIDSIDQHGRLMVWGGNQSDRVSLAPFEKSRVIAVRWPLFQGIRPHWPPPPLPRMQVYTESSRNEA